MNSFNILTFLKRQGFNLVILAFVLFMLSQRLPHWLEAYRMQDSKAHVFQVVDRDGHQVQIPKEFKKPLILVFWATWCGPCEVELNRYKAAIENGEIQKDAVAAISIKEEPNEVFKLAAERNYPFPVYVDTSGESGVFYKVFATPTVVHIDKESNISWVGTGVSPTAIFRAKKFLAD